MQQRTSLRIAHLPGEGMPADRAAKPFTPDQKREFFKGLVVASLDAGFLRYSRRQELLKTAARLGIPEFEACLLIAEAQFRSGNIDAVELAMAPGPDPNAVAAGLSASTQLTLALLAAAVVDVLIVCWLL